MTITLSYKEYVGCDGSTYFVEKYQEKYTCPFWRYGIITASGFKFVYSDELLTRPNLKKLNIL